MDSLHAIPATLENVRKLDDALQRAVAGMGEMLKRQRKQGTFAPGTLTVPAKFEIAPGYEVVVSLTIHAPLKLPERTREIQSLRVLDGGRSAWPPINNKEGTNDE